MRTLNIHKHLKFNQNFLLRRKDFQQIGSIKTHITLIPNFFLKCKYGIKDKIGLYSLKKTKNSSCSIK